MQRLQLAAGVSAVFLGLIYVVAFAYFGFSAAYPSDGSPEDQMRFLADNQVALSLVNLLMYVVFGVLLSVLVVGLHQRLKTSNPAVVSIGSAMGLVWVGLVIASGMISTVGLRHSIELVESHPEAAYALWRTISVLTESLGGGNELVGGLWILLVSAATIQARVFSRPLSFLGAFAGLMGVATVYPDETFTELFGLSQLVWFLWLGAVLITEKLSDTPP